MRVRAEGSSWLAATLVGALSAVLGLITLGHKSLWYDEAYDAVHANDAWTTLLHRVGATEMSQAVYLVALKPWVALTPATETWLRLPSVALAALAAALAVPLGTRLFDRTTGIVAGVLLATNEMLVSWSQQARTYTLVAAAVVVTGLLLLRALDDPSRLNWCLYGAACAFAVYCHFWAGFVVVAEALSLLVAPRRPSWRRIGEGAAVFLALASVALYFTATAGRNQLLWIHDPTPSRLLRILEGSTGQNRLAWIAALGGLGVLGRRLARSRAWRSDDAFRLVLVAGWIVLPFALGLLVSLTAQPILVQRYAIVVTPALALAGAVAIVALTRLRRTAAIVALTAVVALSALQISRWYRSETENWRAAVGYAEIAHGGRLPIVVAPAYAVEGFRFYAPTTPISTTASGGRDVVVVRAGPRQPIDGLVDALYGAGGWRATADQSFGKIHVITVQPS
jgi:mannosyltransferase